MMRNLAIGIVGATAMALATWLAAGLGAGQRVPQPAAAQSGACDCGMEFCVDGRLQRCMAADGGVCRWYETDEVC